MLFQLFNRLLVACLLLWWQKLSISNRVSKADQISQPPLQLSLASSVGDLSLACALRAGGGLAVQLPAASFPSHWWKARPWWTGLSPGDHAKKATA